MRLKGTHLQFAHRLRSFASITVKQYSQGAVPIAGCKSFEGQEDARRSVEVIVFAGGAARIQSATCSDFTYQLPMCASWVLEITFCRDAELHPEQCIVCDDCGVPQANRSLRTGRGKDDKTPIRPSRNSLADPKRILPGLR